MDWMLPALNFWASLTPLMAGGIVAVIYFVGAVTTSGVIGGIRQEMEGVGDLVVVYFWPVSCVLWLAVQIYRLIYRAGERLGNQLGTSRK